MLAYKTASSDHAREAVTEIGLSLSEVLAVDGVYSMLDDSSPADRLVVIRGYAGQCAFWASKGILLPLSEDTYRARKFRKTQETLLLGFEVQ